MTARVLDFAPRQHRNAVAALLALPGDVVIGRDSTGDITAALALACLRNGHTTAADVLHLLAAGRRPRTVPDGSRSEET